MTYYNAPHGDGQTQARAAAGDVGHDDGIADSREPPVYRCLNQLLRERGELLERPCAHLYETGGLRRTHVRGHANVLKRLLIHASAFNLGLWMRKLFGIGTPGALQGRVLAPQSVFGLLGALIYKEIVAIWNRLGRWMPMWPVAITVAARA